MEIKSMKRLKFNIETSIENEGLAVDWDRMIVYVGNTQIPCIYYFQLNAPETYFDKN